MTPDDKATLDRAIAAHFAPVCEQLAHHAVLQQEIVRRMRKPARFGVVTTNTGNYLVNENKSGVIRSLHNPSTADLKPKLYDGANGGNGTPDFSAVLSPGETRNVFIVFHSGLLSMGDAGVCVDGELDA
jgi:hypothetical protein